MVPSRRILYGLRVPARVPLRVSFGPAYRGRGRKRNKAAVSDPST